jgi:hypothetical protein
MGNVAIRYFDLANLPDRVLLAPNLVSGMQALVTNQAAAALVATCAPDFRPTVPDAAEAAGLEMSSHLGEFWQDSYSKPDWHRDYHEGGSRRMFSYVHRLDGGTCLIAPNDGDEAMANPALRHMPTMQLGNHVLKTLGFAWAVLPGYDLLINDRIIHCGPFTFTVDGQPSGLPPALGPLRAVRMYTPYSKR